MTEQSKPVATVFHYESLEWDRPMETAAPGTAPPKALVEAAKKSGARRKKIVRGEGGFFMNRSALTPGFRVPPHKHNHSEMLIVLEGGCQFDDGETLGSGDTIVIEANIRYGFTCGDQGMDFLTVRQGEASVDI